MFKQGAFVNILSPDSKQWKEDFENLRRFPSLDHVELWTEHIPRGSELEEVKSTFRGIKLIVHAPFIHLSLVSHLPEVVAITENRFNDTIAFASQVQAHVVTFHAGSYPLFEPRREMLEKLADRFERFTEMTDPVATLENMPTKSYGTTREAVGKLSDYEEILRLLPKLSFTLDIGHCLQNDDDFICFLKKHAQRISNIHLHDGISRGRGHLRLGAGNLNLQCLLTTLHDISFEKFLSIETISFEDTQASWNVLLDAEILRTTSPPELAVARARGRRLI